MPGSRRVHQRGDGTSLVDDEATNETTLFIEEPSDKNPDLEVTPSPDVAALQYGAREVFDRATLSRIASVVLDAIGLTVAWSGPYSIRLSAAGDFPFLVHSLPLASMPSPSVPADQPQVSPGRLTKALLAILKRTRITNPISLGIRKQPRTDELNLLLSATSRHMIATPDNAPLALVAIDGQTLEVQPIYPWPAPPVWSWLQDSDDEGLIALASERLPGDRWVALTVAGMLARLYMPATREQSRARLAALRSGVWATPATAGRVWIRSLNTAHRNVVERIARARAGQLFGGLRAFLDDVAPDGADISAQWRGLCHARDDLEGILVLLREAAGGQLLEYQLRTVDEVGRAVRYSWPSSRVVDDERLRRVALSDPGAWWGSTAYNVRLL